MKKPFMLRPFGLGLLVLMLVLAFMAGQRYRRWRRDLVACGSLPQAPVLQATRRLEMWASHLMIVVVLLAVFLARGVGVR